MKNLVTKLGKITRSLRKLLRELLGKMFLGGIIFFLLGALYLNYRKRAFNEKAENAFKQVLLQKMQEDSLEVTYFSTSGRKKKDVECPDTVYVKDDKGIHAYRLDKNKSSKNIEEDARLRIVHSYYLAKSPLEISALYTSWKQHLEQEKLLGTCALQLSVSDEHQNIISETAPHNTLLTGLTPSFYITIGYRCEIEIQGFFNPSWYIIVGVEGLIYGFFYWLFVVGISLLLQFRERKYVKTLVPTSPDIYRLKRNIMFDAGQRKLIVKKNETLMSPQPSTLLRHLLDAPNHILKDEEIQKIFWSDKIDNVAKMQNVVSRLRDVFKDIPSIEVQRFENCGYQLKIRNDRSRIKDIGKKEDS